MKETLKKLGLSDHETVIYTFLLEKGSSSATDIELKAKLHRPLVYQSLESLSKKGLVHISPKGKRKLYVAESPSVLERIFKEFEDKFISDIEDLHQLYDKGNSSKPIVKYTEGKQALKDSYLDVINTLPKDARYYRYASMESYNKEKFLPKGYKNMRDKKGLERHIITNESSKSENERLGKKVKVVPTTFDLFEYNLSQVIYGDKIAILDYDSQSVITLEHKRFADFQKKIFELLFSKLKD